MEKQTQLFLLSIIIIFSIFASLLFIAQPIIVKAKSEMQILENNYMSIVSEKTGLVVSYKSLSPSILSGLRLSSIVLYDKTANEQIAEINSIKLNWNIFKILDGDISDAFGDLVISGVFLNYNDTENSTVRTKITNLFRDNQVSTSSGFLLPVNILIKNSAIVYSNGITSVTLRLSRLKLFNQKSTEFLALDSRGSMKITLSGSKNFPLKAFSFNYLVQGGIASTFSDSYAQLSFYNIDTSLFSADRLNFYANYKDSIVTLEMIQNNMPYKIIGSCNTKSHDVSVELNTKNLQPLSIVTFKKTNNFNVSRFYGTTMSGLYAARYNIDSKDLEYTVDGNIQFPDLLFNERLQADIDLEGTLNQVTISKVAVKSKYCDASYSGTFDIQNVLPQGILNVERVLLPSGNDLATEIYISPMDEGFLCFIPQLSFGETSLTAVQINLVPQNGFVDFSFEATDYSHVDISEPGKFTLSGSYEYSDDLFLQTQISCQNFFIDTVLAIIQWVGPTKNTALIATLQSSFKDYISTFDMFVSSDLKHITYNTPYFIAANITKENEILLLSFDGTEDLMHLSQFEILFSGQKLTATFTADFSDKDEIFFSSDISFNTIPYNFSGIYEATKSLKISGNYNFYLDAEFGNNLLKGQDTTTTSVSMESVPLIFNDYNFLLELQSKFNVSDNGWLYSIDNFAIQENSGKLISNPRLQLAGVLDRYGFTSSSLVFNDTVSTLDGSVGIGWSVSESILHSAFLNLDLSEEFSPEKVTLSLQASNPNNVVLQAQDFVKKLFFNVKGSITELQFAHVLKDQTSDDILTFSINALGSVDTPSVQVAINRGQIKMQGIPVIFSGPVILQDKDFSFSDFKLALGTFKIKDFLGTFNLTTMSGSASAFVYGQLQAKHHFATKKFESPMTAIFSTNQVGTDVNDKEYVANINLKKLTGTFFDERDNVSIHVEKNSKQLSFYVSKTKALSGTISSEGEVSIIATEDSPVAFICDGYMNKTGNYLAFNDIYAKGEKFSHILDLKQFTLYSGDVTGFMTIEGNLDTPVINGYLKGSNARATSPINTMEIFHTDTINCTIVDSKFSLNDIILTGEKSKGQVALMYSVDIDSFSSFTQHVTAKSIGTKGIYGYFALPFGEIEAIATVDFDMDFAPFVYDIKGSVNATNIEAVISKFTMEDDSDTSVHSPIRTYADIVINMDQKAKVYIPSKTTPVIRGLVGQIKPLHFIMDTGMYTYSIEGELIVKSGEVIYINRTFYLKNGTVELDGDQDLFDPVISFRAEIREQDDIGGIVKIILSAEEQHLSQFSPKLYSDPTKSQTEIMSLLGQAVIGDTDSFSTAIATGLDYFLQIGIFRTFENALRDFFNFDIFSFRTTFLQNAMIEAFDTDDDTDDTNTVSFGNYLDGSTVYIGKYIGDILYADMMLEVVYDENVATNGTESGLGLQPEIGLELPSPFATIRWSISPEANSNWNLLVPYTSISLSWKFML